ncbi:MAG: MCE family protein [Deltaproteobacteria bacterium]|nr:MCE family protein [Deltaproteobacteria bacterium]
MKQVKDNIQVQVGAFLAIGALLFMAAIFILGSKTSLFQPYVNLFCYFDDISGLRVGAPVQLAGVNVGFIDSIEFEEIPVKAQTEPNAGTENLTQEEPTRTIVKIRVGLMIESAFQERIREDSTATVKTQGILGDQMIYLTVGSKGDYLTDGEEISFVSNPTGFSQLVNKGDGLLDTTQDFLVNTDLLITQVNDVVKEIREGEGLAHEVIYGEDHGQMMRRLDRVMANFERTSASLASISDKIDKGEGTLGALVNDDSLFFDIKTLFGKANRNRTVRSVIRYIMKTKEKEHLK